MPEISGSKLLEGLEEGDLIRISYIRQSGNYRWYESQATGVYLGRGITRPEQFFISFRPLAGTTEFDANHLTEVERLDTKQDRWKKSQVLRRDDRVKLPKQRKGAVPAP